MLGFDLRERYSGRGMFGRTCFGFVTDKIGAELNLAACLLDLYGEGSIDLIKRMAECAAQDSMGLKSIYYYYRLEWSEEETEEDEDQSH